MLNGKQRSYLRGLGNNIEDIIHIGKNGIDEPLLNQIRQAIDARELIKISVLKNNMLTVNEACDSVCDLIVAEPVQIIGNKFIIYKKSYEKQSIIIPI